MGATGFLQHLLVVAIQEKADGSISGVLKHMLQNILFLKNIFINGGVNLTGNPNEIILVHFLRNM